MNECVAASDFQVRSFPEEPPVQIKSETPDDPGRAHLITRRRTNASGAYSVWISQVVTRYNDHFLTMYVRFMVHLSQDLT
jgi:hypothetical protein